MNYLFIHKINIITLHFIDSKRCNIMCYLIEYKKTKDGTLVTKENISDLHTFSTKDPVLIIACGYGIIIKDKNDMENQEIIEKVRFDKESFIFNEDENYFSFARKTLLESYISVIQKNNITVFPIKFLSQDMLSTELQVYNYAVNFLKQEAGFCKFYNPSNYSIVISERLYKRMRIYALISTLFILTINYFIKNSITKEYTSLNFEVGKLKAELNSKAQHRQNIKLEMEKFSNTRVWPTSYISDCIAASIPDQICLNQISIYPYKKQPDKKELPQFWDNLTIIDGYATTYDAILALVSTLEVNSFSNKVNLDYVKQAKQPNEFDFKISITLK